VGAGHQHDHSGGAKSLAIAFFLNLSFTMFEVIGGLMTNSVAILSDAVHDAGDSLALGLAWYLHRVSSREGNTNFTYGYRRFSTLGALIAGVLLVIGLGFVLVNAIPRLAHPEPVHGAGMLGIAVVGIIFNGAAALRLQGGSSLNERVASWHLLEDVLGWVAVLIGSVIVLFWNFPIVDPILSILISAFVLWNVIKHLRKVFAVFLQRVPDGFDTDGFVRSVQALSKVKDVHHTHVWTLDGEHHVLTTHIVVEKSATRQDVAKLKCQVTGFVNPEEFEHVTIDVEVEGESCASSS
jgi:cobalt-zinc-cadmium efflux system protein